MLKNENITECTENFNIFRLHKKLQLSFCPLFWTARLRWRSGNPNIPAIYHAGHIVLLIAISLQKQFQKTRSSAIGFDKIIIHFLCKFAYYSLHHVRSFDRFIVVSNNLVLFPFHLSKRNAILQNSIIQNNKKIAHEANILRPRIKGNNVKICCVYLNIYR